MHVGCRSMCGVIVVDADRSRSTNLGRDAYIMDHCLDIVMIIWGSINCPTVICLPIALLFSWEMPLVKSTAPGVFFIIFAFKIYFYSLLFLDLLNQKPKNTLLQFSIAVSIFYLTVKGLTPLDRVGVWRFVFLCAGAEHVVLGESPSGSITLVLNRGKYFSACYIIPSATGNPPTRARAFSINKEEFQAPSPRHQEVFLAPLPGRLHQHPPGS